MIQVCSSPHMRLATYVQTYLVRPFPCTFSANREGASSTGQAASSYICQSWEGSGKSLWRWSEGIPAGLMDQKLQRGLCTQVVGCDDRALTEERQRCKVTALMTRQFFLEMHCLSQSRKGPGKGGQKTFFCIFLSGKPRSLGIQNSSRKIKKSTNLILA